MSRPIAVIFMVGMLIMATSCQSRIEKLEKIVYSDDFNYDTKGIAQAGELLDLYVKSAESNPKAEGAADQLFKAAELALNLDKTQQSLDLYNRIIYSYPDYEKGPECLFLLAFIYENNLQNYGKAKELYELFIQKYPDHEFADDAQFSLQYLGKSPEELMKEFEAKNKDTLNPAVL